MSSSSNKPSHFRQSEENALENELSQIPGSVKNIAKNQFSSWKTDAGQMWKELLSPKKAPEIDPATGQPKVEEKEIDKNSNFTPLGEKVRENLAKKWDLDGSTQAHIDALRRSLHRKVTQNSDEASRWIQKRDQDRANNFQREEQRKKEEAEKAKAQNSSSSEVSGKQRARLGAPRKKAKVNLQTNYEKAGAEK